MGEVIYHTDEVGYTELISWEGPIGRDLRRRVRTLEFRARMQVGVRTGALKARIGSEYDPFSRTELVARVGANPRKGGRVGYSVYHHEGTRPHVILPKKGKYLRFKVAGKVVFARKVNHPGTRANPYLTAWLAEAVR